MGCFFGANGKTGKYKVSVANTRIGAEMRIIKAKDYKDMSRKAANIISAQVIMKPNCVLGLATGSTPIGTYEQLVGHLWAGSLGSIREQAEQSRGSKPVKNIPPWPLHQFLLPDLLEFQS